MTGPLGFTGEIGATGESGVEGATGPRGAAGDTGHTGSTGMIGDTGMVGVPGVEGLSSDVSLLEFLLAKKFASLALIIVIINLGLDARPWKSDTSLIIYFHLVLLCA